MNEHTLAKRTIALTAILVVTAISAHAAAQSPANTDPPSKPPIPASAGLDSLAWLAGCWQGAVAGREFRETWSLPRGGMMVGTSQTVQKEKTTDFEYLRIEARADGAYYVVSPPGKKETSFRYAGATDVQGRMTYAFENPAELFPRRLAYGRGEEGWLYAAVEGKIDNQDRSVIYPMRRIDCRSNELIEK